MTGQSFRHSFSVMGLAALLLTGCSTLDFQDADPEKYMAFNCEQLFQLAESYRPQTQELLFADVSDLERRNEGNRASGVLANPRPYELEQDRERRSIDLARRKKGC